MHDECDHLKWCLLLLIILSILLIFIEIPASIRSFQTLKAANTYVLSLVSKLVSSYIYYVIRSNIKLYYAYHNFYMLWHMVCVKCTAQICQVSRQLIENKNDNKICLN